MADTPDGHARSADDPPECPRCGADYRRTAGRHYAPTCKCPTEPVDLRARLGSNVADRRRALGLTQQQLADDLGDPRPRVSELEAGKWWPQPERLVAIAEALECEPADLLR